MARILIIEDNPANLDLMVFLLEAFGHQTCVAMDGEDGLAAARREEIDLIICDIQIPKLDGIQVTQRLRQDRAWRVVPIVAVTAFAMVGDRDKILAKGFDGYVSKPITPETFVGQIESFLHAGPLVNARDSSSKTPDSGGGRATILVVDNSAVNLQLARSTLEPFGYEILPAGGMADALETARRAAVDLILSDVHMPNGTGFDLIRAVKADPRLSQIPFIFISSTVWRDSDRATGLGLGAVKFIERPIDPGALLAEIEECLR